MVVAMTKAVTTVKFVSKIGVFPVVAQPGDEEIAVFIGYRAFFRFGNADRSKGERFPRFGFEDVAAQREVAVLCTQQQDRQEAKAN